VDKTREVKIMRHGWHGLVLGCAQLLWLAGCSSTQTARVPVQGESLAADLAVEAEPRLARMQAAPPRADTRPAPAPKAAPATILPPVSAPARNVQLPALPAAGRPPAAPIATIAPPGGTQPVKLAPPPPEKSITVRAWVNGKPIFDEEVMQSIPGALWRTMAAMPEAQRIEKLTEIYNKTLDHIIDQEVAYQEALQKLQKANPVTLDKLRRLAAEDFEKQLDKVAKQISPEELKELEKSLRRQMERNFISMEYMRSRIFPALQRIGYDEIKEYYDTHANEFTKIETVKWQNVFIAVKPPRVPTVAAARQIAEQLIATCRTPDDFARLLPYDDGDAKFRGGEGMGNRRGEIKPAEIEEHLLRLQPGQIGPIVNMTTGVHIFRLVSRDPGGLQPLNEDVQNQIRAKLRSQIADREYKRIVRELRSRAVVEVERGG
jgi:hypothetical protein